jgi:hypothetical protein
MPPVKGIALSIIAAIQILDNSECIANPKTFIIKY